MTKTGTLRSEGAIGAREFALRRGEEGLAEAFVCLACSAETAPDRAAFAAHTCTAALEPAGEPTTTRRGRGRAQEEAA